MKAWQLKISSLDIRRMSVCAERDYPKETVGALLGRIEDACYFVMGIVPLENREERCPERAFFVPPEKVLELENLALSSGSQVIGWYHSHPDSRAMPSREDLRCAFHRYVYPILSVVHGLVRELECWRLRDEGDGFEPVEIVDIE